MVVETNRGDMRVIKLNDRFSFGEYRRGWVIEETIPTEKRNGETGAKIHPTYYGTIKQVANELVNRTAGEAETLTHLILLLENAENRILDALKAMGEE